MGVAFLDRLPLFNKATWKVRPACLAGCGTHLSSIQLENAVLNMFSSPSSPATRTRQPGAYLLRAKVPNLHNRSLPPSPGRGHCPRLERSAGCIKSTWRLTKVIDCPSLVQGERSHHQCRYLVAQRQDRIWCSQKAASQKRETLRSRVQHDIANSGRPSSHQTDLGDIRFRRGGLRRGVELSEGRVRVSVAEPHGSQLVRNQAAIKLLCGAFLR